VRAFSLRNSAVHCNQTKSKPGESHVSVLVLEVRLSVVTNNPVRVSRGRRLRVRRMDLSPFRIPQTLVQTLAQVHVANRVNAFWELDGTRQLAVPVAPVVLDAFHVPLVDDHDNFVALGVVDLFEKLGVALVHANSLPLGEEGGHRSDIPVHEVLVHALFGEGGGAN